MSDEAPKPPKPMTKTSAVPLKKETVRVTLKASDAPAPMAPPSAPAPPVAPVAPSVPMAPTPPAPPAAAAPSGPPRPSAPAPAPTVALRTPGGIVGGGVPAPAPTVPLKLGGVAATSPLQTQPLTAPGSPQLPKATVPLGGTQALGRPTGLQTTPGTIGGFDDDEVEENGTVTSVLAILTLVAALAAFAFQFMVAKTWVDSTVPTPKVWSDYNALHE